MENFISKSVNLIPSPVNKSAIPWRDANVNNFANAGTSCTLKLSIINFELEILFCLIEWKSKLPSSKPFINLYLLTKGLAKSE